MTVDLFKLKVMIKDRGFLTRLKRLIDRGWKSLKRKRKKDGGKRGGDRKDRFRSGRGCMPGVNLDRRKSLISKYPRKNGCRLRANNR